MKKRGENAIKSFFNPCLARKKEEITKCFENNFARKLYHCNAQDAAIAVSSAQ
jgi:hypothetical protein